MIFWWDVFLYELASARQQELVDTALAGHALGRAELVVTDHPDAPHLGIFCQCPRAREDAA